MSAVAAEHPPAADPVAQLVGVTRTFPGSPDVHAVRDCSLEIRRGDFMTIIGPSGSGKSSLLNLLGLLDRPTTGRYVLEGRDTSSMRERDRTRLRGRTLGFVFQSFHLLGHRTALDNVQMSLLYRGVGEARRRARAREALEAVGLSHRATFHPTRLSGGERQRVALARLLVQGADVVVADEPVSSLDPTTSARVLDLLCRPAVSSTAVVSMHQPELARDHFTRMIGLRSGRVVLDVPAAELAARHLHQLYAAT